MSEFKSHSQAGQDIFAAYVLEYKKGGSFLDIGCAHPVDLSNTYALESGLGWRGRLIDGNPECIAQCHANRLSPAVCADATNYEFGLHWGSREEIDYVSLDVDEAQVDALANLLDCARAAKARFLVLTVETDLYRFGRERHDAIHKMLSGARYLCVADEVKNENLPFETFWVDATHPGVVERARPFTSIGLDWKDVLKLGGAS